MLTECEFKTKYWENDKTCMFLEDVGITIYDYDCT